MKIIYYIKYYIKKKNNITIILALISIFMIYYQIPEYPIIYQKDTAIKSNTYIDYGNKLIQETDYIVKIPKIYYKIHDVDVKLIGNVEGLIGIYDVRGYNFTDNYFYDNTNNTIKFKNPDKINPILLRIIYVKKGVTFSEEDHKNKIKDFEVINQVRLNIKPLEKKSNDSFYLYIENTCGYDIKRARIPYNIIEDVNSYLNFNITTWKNESFMMYENDVPVEKGYINLDGIVYINVKMLKQGEHRTYLIKKK